MVQRRLALRCGMGFCSRSTLCSAAAVWLVLLQVFIVVSNRRRVQIATLHGDPDGSHSLPPAAAAISTAEERTKLARQVGGPLQGDDGFFYPGRLWLDTNGRLIQAHGGGVLYVPESRTYYWYGENKDGKTVHRKGGLARVDVIGVSCYRSEDLMTWEDLGVVLKAEPDDPGSDLHPSKVVERPKVVYNEKTKKYVMWMHIDNATYEVASAGVAVSDSPTGPFKYLGKVRPWDSDSRDLTLFKDDDGAAYLVYSSEMNSCLHFGRLSDDYLRPEGEKVRVLPGASREAPAVFKHKNLYYMVTSGCTGWHPNQALVHASASVFGPWELLCDPAVDPDQEFRRTTFQSQATFVLPLPGHPDLFVFMADRWMEGNLQQSRYVWLPLVMEERHGREADAMVLSGGGAGGGGGGVLARPILEWHVKWQLPDGWNDAIPTSSAAEP